ncbi:MAG: YigZ family protein [bacterium]|nr:YigZ family protein [bacterium]
MTESDRIVYEGGMGEITEKKSRFLATVMPVKTEEEALRFIEAMRKKYWDASHNCYAYTLGDRQEICRASDDGEPAQTAGRPMLDVLLGEHLHDVCVVVTRYFGGTLLGTGGLVRAYSAAVKEGLAQSTIVERREGRKWQLLTDYNGIGKIQYLLAKEGLRTLNTTYTDVVTVEILVPTERNEQTRKQLTEATNGRCQIVEGELLFFGEAAGELVFLE